MYLCAVKEIFMIIRKLRNGFLIRGVTALMGLVFLNGMVDPPDLYSEAVAEDLSYNEMESILELVVECVLQYENFFEEYDDDDAGKTLLKKRPSLDVFMPPNFSLLVLNHLYCRNPWTEVQSQQPKDIWQTPITPPPDFHL